MVYLPKAVDDERLATAKGFNADTDTDSSDSESDEEKLEQYVPRPAPPGTRLSPISPGGWMGGWVDGWMILLQAAAYAVCRGRSLSLSLTDWRVGGWTLRRHHVTVFTQDQGGIQSTDEEDQGTDYIYFLGIIDILQPFNMRKRAEHGFKSFRFDGVRRLFRHRHRHRVPPPPPAATARRVLTAGMRCALSSSRHAQDQISAVNPRLYARRFKEYVFARVRQPDTPQTPREVIGLPPRLPEGTLPPPPPPPPSIHPSIPDLILAAAAAAIALLIWEVLTPPPQFLPGRTGGSHHDDDDSDEGSESKRERKQAQLTDPRGESDGGGKVTAAADKQPRERGAGGEGDKVKERKKRTEQGQGQAEGPPPQTKKGATMTTKPAAKKTKKNNSKKKKSEGQAATKTADSSRSYDYEAGSSAGSEASSGGLRENHEAAAGAASGDGKYEPLPHHRPTLTLTLPFTGPYDDVATHG